MSVSFASKFVVINNSFFVTGIIADRIPGGMCIVDRANRMNGLDAETFNTDFFR